ncbi:HipA family kinase [Neobacillus drentensis]|uniref:HipA family kinase n=1 Tax=Neobacillus drentensis TaxID=220684 RepID=UPI003000EE20
MNKGKDHAEQLIYPVQYIQGLIGGTAHVILFSNGKKYVVKWFDVYKRRGKEVINEYLIGKLAQLLSLPVVPFQLVYIPKEFIKRTPELHSTIYHYTAGIHYGCEFIENSTVFANVRETPPTKKEVKNRDMLAGIMVFDQWVNNSDRGTQNVLFEILGDGGYYVHMIDHGRVFPGRYEWSAQTLIEEPVYNYHWPFYIWTYTLLDSPNELTSYIDTIVVLPNESIYEIIQSIPKEWKVRGEDKEALYQFLLKQKSNLPEIVDQIIEYHNNLNEQSQ